MARLILAIVAFVLALAVLKMVIVVIVIAGLIFRTKETIGLLLLGGFLTLLAAQPLIGLGLLGIAAIVKAVRKQEPPDSATPALLAAPDDTERE